MRASNFGAPKIFVASFYWRWAVVLRHSATFVSHFTRRYFVDRIETVVSSPRARCYIEDMQPAIVCPQTYTESVLPTTSVDFHRLNVLR